MAVFVLKNAYVSINSVDLSDHVKSVTLTGTADMVETTAMGKSTKTRIAGLKDWTAEVEFNQDFAASKVDATLWPLLGAAAFAVEFRPDAGSVSATNPKWTGTALLPSYSPIDGSVGAMATTRVSLQGSDDLTRATS